MKNNTRAVLAGALVLGLAAGGGTFALWQASTEVQGGGIVTGELNITADGDAVYDDLSTDAANDWDNVVDHMVPGDWVTSTQTFTVKAAGKNLKAKLGATTGQASYPGGAVNPADFEVATVATVDGVAVDPTAELTAADLDGKQVKVVTTYTFKSTTSGTNSQNGAVSLTEGGVKVEQVG